MNQKPENVPDAEIIDDLVRKFWWCGKEPSNDGLERKRDHHVNVRGEIALDDLV